AAATHLCREASWAPHRQTRTKLGPVSAPMGSLATDPVGARPPLPRGAAGSCRRIRGTCRLLPSAYCTSRTDDFNLLIIDELVVAVHLYPIITGLGKNTAFESVTSVDRLISRREFDDALALPNEAAAVGVHDVDP